MSRMRTPLQCWLALAVLLCCMPLTHASVTTPPTLDLAAYRGKVVYLDFWASWCGPCRASFPWMDSMQQAYGARGLAVVGLNVDRHREAADKFLDTMKPQFAIAFDPSGSWAEKYKVNGMPESLLIDRQGRVRYQHIGFRPEDQHTLNQQVRELLAEKP